MKISLVQKCTRIRFTTLPRSTLAGKLSRNDKTVTRAVEVQFMEHTVSYTGWIIK